MKPLILNSGGEAAGSRAKRAIAIEIKTYTYFVERVCPFRNFLYAYRKARRGKLGKAVCAFAEGMIVLLRSRVTERLATDTVTTAAGSYAVNTYQVTVSDGQLTLELNDLGGTTARVALNGLRIQSV